MLSVYVHIPYCLQRCRYCDFTTFEQSEILPAEKYVQQVLSEVRTRAALWQERRIRTIYLGGGTPSLLEPQLLGRILDALRHADFHWDSQTEMTIEINPATMDARKLDAYQGLGFNRFSVGAQTFNDDLLKLCGRKHSAAETRETLNLLRERSLNYSFDLLFALPHQSLAQLEKDLDEVCAYAPPHLSAYCLTVPEGHPMNRGRAPEDEQVEMFDRIEKRLASIGLRKYEISNFATPGFESRHNLTYWNDVDYWGIGLSAHSYNSKSGPYGERFWNSKDLVVYETQKAVLQLPKEQREFLQEHEAMTDYCHMFLRMRQGLSMAALRKKFSGTPLAQIEHEIDRLQKDGLLAASGDHLSLTPAAELLSNRVFERLTFLPPRSALTRENSTTY